MNKYFLYFAVFLLAIIISSKFIFLSSSNLNYFPSFTLDGWSMPYNSLLSDTITQFEPWRIFNRGSFLILKLPLWNNLNAGGVPYVASMQNAFFFPLNFIYYIFGPGTLLSISFIKIVLFFLFTYYYLKTLKCGKLASILGAIVASSSYMILWVQWPQTNVYLFFPLLLILTETIEKIKSKKIYILSVSAIYFLGLLGGHPETLFNIFVFHLIYIVVRKKGMNIFLSSILGLLIGMFLGAFILFPFLEYLFNSYAFFERSEGLSKSFPITSLVFLVFPQLLGAPHFHLYKAISSASNYAEYTSGSVGLIAFIAIVISFIKFRTQKIVNHSLILILISLAFAYLLDHLTGIIKIPILNSNTNERFIIFAGYFSSIPIAVITDKLKFRFPQSNGKLISVATLSLFILLFFLHPSTKEGEYILYISKYLLFTSLTTVLFFFFLLSNFKFKSFVIILVLSLQLILPNLFYNGISGMTSYFPKNDFIKTLLNNKDKRILQIGNMNLPSDINMAYGLESAENYDALDIKNYKTAFDMAFSKKTHLGLVDQAGYEEIKRFGVGLVISDYDMNSKKITLQGKVGQRIALTNNMHIEFSGIGGSLTGIRFLTQTYNRVNNCSIKVFIIDKEVKKTIGKSSVSCKDFRDNMFYTIPFSNTVLNKESNYQIIISPNDISNNNYIAVKGNDTKNPYLDILIKNEKAYYTKIFQKNSVNIFIVKNSNKIDSNLNFKILSKDADHVSLLTNSREDGYINLKNTYYPGWKAEIDGKPTLIYGKTPFMKINVPSGTHYIKFYYKSTSFILGVGISVTTLIFLLTYFLRSIIHSEKFKTLYSDYIINSKKLLSGKKLKTTLLKILFSLVLGVIMGIGIIGLIPQGVGISYTTSINWLTKNNHSLTVDYFKMGIMLLSVSISILLTWIKLTLKK